MTKNDQQEKDVHKIVKENVSQANIGKKRNEYHVKIDVLNEFKNLYSNGGYIIYVIL